MTRAGTHFWAGGTIPGLPPWEGGVRETQEAPIHQPIRQPVQVDIETNCKNFCAPPNV